MNDYSEYFNPELEAILQEIARDPRAKMLQVPSSGALVYATKQPQIGVAAPSLTSAEVELLNVHREELAERLKERCLIEFFRQPGAEKRLHKSVEVGRRLEVRDVNEWQRDTEGVLGYQAEDERSKLASDVLQQCIQDDRDRPVSITQIATAMMRVAPLEQARVYIALDLLEKGREADACSLYREVLADKPSSLIESYAYEGLANALWNRGVHEDAIKASQSAAAASRTRAIPVISGLSYSLQLGDIQSASTWCHSLEAFNDDPLEDELNWFFDPNRTGQRSVEMPNDSLKSAHRLAAKVSERARKIINAFI